MTLGPSTTAGKKAAAGLIEIQRLILAELGSASAAGPRTAAQIAESIGAAEHVETVHQVLQHLAANPNRGVAQSPHPDPTQIRYAPR